MHVGMQACWHTLEEVELDTIALTSAISACGGVAFWAHGLALLAAGLRTFQIGFRVSNLLDRV